MQSRLNTLWGPGHNDEGRNGEGPLYCWLGSLGSIVSSPAGSRAEPQPKTVLVHFYFERWQRIVWSIWSQITMSPYTIRLYNHLPAFECIMWKTHCWFVIQSHHLSLHRFLWYCSKKNYTLGARPGSGSTGPIKPVSHRAYDLYGQVSTVNAYGHPQMCPWYGLVRLARTVSTVSTYGLYVHTRSPVRPVRSPVRSLRSIVRSIRSVATVSTVTYGHLERAVN